MLIYNLYSLYSFYERALLSSLSKEEIYSETDSLEKGTGMENPHELTGKLLGTCRLEQIIGRGGSSVVYLAQQLRPQRQVAVKILLPDQLLDSQLHQQFLRRFEHEADIIARLEHEHIIKIFEYNEQYGYAYLVMPYISGGNLLKLLKLQGRLSLQQTARYLTQAAAALDYAHANGVIHRDLKPGNFLLRQNGELVLSDFGIAHIMQHSNQLLNLTTPSLLLGTPEYMAPEMARGEAVGHFTDIYELGIVLYQLLSGDLPFKGETPYSILLKHLEERVPLLHPLYPDISSSVDGVIQRATAKRREDRFSSAEQMAQALQSVLRAPQQQVPNLSDEASISTAITYRRPEPQRIPPTLGVYHPSPVERLIAAPVTPEQVFLPAFTQAVGGPSRQGNEEKTFASPVNRTIAPPVPLLPPRQRRSPKSFVLLMILVLSLFAFASTALMAYAQWAKQPTREVPPHIPTLGEKAQVFVQQYYANLNNRNYQAAYPMWQQKTTSTLCRFLDGYQSTEQVKIVTRVGQLKGDKIDVPITIVATEALPTGRVISTYQGYEELQQVNGSLKITGGSIPQTSREPSPMTLLPVLATGTTTTLYAQSVIQQFYNYINQRDYPAAYSLWGQDYHTQTRYCDFVDDYMHTLHDDVQVNTPTPLADGTAQVGVMISAQESTPATHIYTATYIVGQENGAWKILSGTQNLVQ
jgi:serine/threonine protein kinase